MLPTLVSYFCEKARLPSFSSHVEQDQDEHQISGLLSNKVPKVLFLIKVLNEFTGKSLFPVLNKVKTFCILIEYDAESPFGCAEKERLSPISTCKLRVLRLLHPINKAYYCNFRGFTGDCRLQASPSLQQTTTAKLMFLVLVRVS